jgi:NitT/TauT family transport system substrate-binding protein
VSAQPRPASRTARRRRYVAAAAALPLLIGALAACGYGSDDDKSDDATTAPAASAGTKKLSVDQVKIGYFPNLTHATALVGLKEGLFQKELGQTRIKPYTFNAGPEEIEALNAGSIDIGWIGPSPAINGYTKSNGASPQLGNTQDVALLNWIRSKGWKVNAQSGKGDVSVIRTDNKITPDAYKQGSIDGAWVPEPTASKLVAEGAKVLLDESTLWPEKKFVITNVIVSQKFLKAHPDVVEAVLRGSVNTNAWIAANSDKAKADANEQIKKLTQKALPPAVLDPAWQSIQVLDDPLARTAGEEAQHAVDAGLLKAPKLNGLYDLTLLNKVLTADGKPTVDAAGLGTQ